jgi:hypothetical protein
MVIISGNSLVFVAVLAVVVVSFAALLPLASAVLFPVFPLASVVFLSSPEDELVLLLSVLLVVMGRRGIPNFYAILQFTTRKLYYSA